MAAHIVINSLDVLIEYGAVWEDMMSCSHIGYIYWNLSSSLLQLR